MQGIHHWPGSFSGVKEYRIVDSNQIFLSQEEVVQLTAYRSRLCQIRWCTENGVRFLVRGDGQLVISRQHVVERLGGNTNDEPHEWVPDYSSLI